MDSFLYKPKALLLVSSIRLEGGKKGGLSRSGDWLVTYQLPAIPLASYYS